MSESKRPSRTPVRLDALLPLLETKLEDEVAVLELLVSEMQKGHEHTELWNRFHEAAVRDDLLAELAFAYEQVVSGRKFKLLSPAAQVEVLMHAATFYDDVFSEYDAAINCLQRVLGLAPAHDQALEKLGPLMRDGQAVAKMADFYAAAAAHKSSPAEQAGLLWQALQLVRANASERDRTIRLAEALLKLDPGQAELRQELEQAYFESGRFADLAELLKRTLASGTCTEVEAIDMHARLLRIYTEKLRDIERAMPHLEELLRADPENAEARGIAERMLTHKPVAARAADALGSAFEAVGAFRKAAEMLTLELEYVRGPRRFELQKRLVVLREQLGDDAAAQALLEALVTSDPSDDELRARYTDLSRRTDKLADSARVLGRALLLVKDPSTRARTGVDLAKALLELGELKRARSVLQDLVTAQADETAALFAAEQLAELYDPTRESKLLAPVLELVARAHPQPESRFSAAERLAKLCENELGDGPRAIAAWRLLVDTPKREQALRALEEHYAAAGAQDELAGVLEARAAESVDPSEARSVALRAAEIRATSEANDKRRLAIWLHLLDVHGPSREAHERVIPLLEQLGKWQELAQVLKDHSVLVADDERPAIFSRLAEVQGARLDDIPGALEAHGQVLTLDPENHASRRVLERLLEAGEHRLAAADVLEPVYRATNDLPGLIRVLEARAMCDAKSERGHAALEEAVDLLAREANDPQRALELAAGALADAVLSRPDHVLGWLTRVELIANGPQGAERRLEPSILAAQLLRALGARPIDSPALARLAESAAEALTAAGSIDDALALYRQLIAFEPTPQRQARLRQLVIEHGTAEDRAALYQSLLEEEKGVRERRALFLELARIEQDELGDSAGAIATCQRALDENPQDVDVEDALLDAFAKTGDRKGLYALLERSLARASGERRTTLLLRMGQVASALGDSARALEHYREVVQAGSLDPELFDRIEAAAAANKQGDFLRELYDHRIAQSPDRFERARWLERLGQVELEQLGDVTSAVSAWKRAARLCEEAPADPDRARALYERVLGATPDDVEAAERLLVLYGRNPDPAHMPTVYATLLKSATDERVAFERLREFEDHAVRSGALDEFCRTVDQMLARHMSAAAARAGELMATKARVLGTDDARRRDSEAVLESLEPSTRSELAAVEDHRRGQGWVLPWSPHEARERTIKELLETAAAHELAGDSVGAANAYQRVLASDPERLDARYALARLLPALGDAESALTALTDLTQHAKSAIREALELQIARLYLDQLNRPQEALSILEQRLAASPADPLTLRVLERALGRAEVRARTAALVERTCEAMNDDARAATLLEALLAAPADAPELKSRARIYERLLESHSADPETALRIALRAVLESPDNETVWSRLDQLARRLGRPEPVADAYKKAFSSCTDPELLERIGRRAIEFHEEWFDDPETVIALLRRMLLSDSTRWSFDRLKLLFSSADRWDEFFALYDDALERTADPGARGELLEDAASAAKDIAKDPDRAIAYYERRVAMGDSIPTIAALLERLYERSGYTGKLIELLTPRLSEQASDDAQAMRARLAQLWLAQGDEPQCFNLVEQILSVDPDSDLVVDLLAHMVLPQKLAPMSLSSTHGGPRASRLPLAKPPPDESARRRLTRVELARAAALLDRRYKAEPISERSVAVLEVLLETAETGDERIVRHRELSRALGELGARARVFEHLASLVSLEPSAPEHRKAFLLLADELGSQARAASVLIEAADACQDTRLAARLVFEAAGVHRDRLNDADRAIELFERAMQLAGDQGPLVLAAARELDPLLAAKAQDERRCAILERIAEVETEPAARREALGEAARIASDKLEDRERAIRLWRARLAHDPSDREALDTLTTLFEQDRRFADLVAALDQRASILDSDLARPDRVRIARTFATELGRPDDAISAWRDVRSQFGIDEENFSALTSLFESLERWEDLARLLDEQARATRATEHRVELLARIGDLFRDRLGDAGRAAESYRAALAFDPADATARRGLSALIDRTDVHAQAVDGLARAYVETRDFGRAAELARSLDVAEDVSADIARAFWWGVARHERDVRGELEPAETALIRAHGHDPTNLEILSTLAAVQSRTPGRALVATLMRLSDAKGGDVKLLKQATEVALRDVGDRRAASELIEKALAMAIERWNRGVEPDSEDELAFDDAGEAPGEVAAWALDELVRLGYDDGNYARVVELLLRGADMPFEKSDVRRMRRDAAAIRAERLHEPALAIELYRRLLDEDPRDENAAKSVVPLAELLEQRGAHTELATLWEQQAEIRAVSDRAAAAELWSRAATIAEVELGDLARAVAGLENAARLAGDATGPLEALARIHAARGDLTAVALVLERLVAGLMSASPSEAATAPSALPPAALRLSETYIALGDRAAARDRLESAVASTNYNESVATRLATLYEEDEDWTHLAELYAAEAKHASDRRVKLGKLRKAAELYLSKKDDRERAVPLLEQALELAPDTPSLSLALADALTSIGRVDRAREVLTQQVERYADRRPKHRALVHLALARTLDASGDRKGALAELEAAARIDPMHSGVLQTLGRVARQEGQLERAQRSYEALLLLRVRPGDEPVMKRVEILLELAEIADALNDPARAEELRESAQVVKKARERSGDELEDLDAAFLDIVSAG